MPKPQNLTRRQRWAPYVRRLADLLALKDWRVAIYESAPENSNSVASVEIPFGRKFAVLRLSDSFLDDTANEQRHTVVHELMHCHINGFSRAVQEHSELPGVLNLAMEFTVDGLADAVAQHMPLPPSNTRSKR